MKELITRSQLRQSVAEFVAAVLSHKGLSDPTVSQVVAVAKGAFIAFGLPEDVCQEAVVALCTTYMLMNGRTEPRSGETIGATQKQGEA